MSKNIILGTAQFGMDYGITNSNGKILQKEVSEILEFAYDKGIKTLDTAQLYGDAEKSLGNNNYARKFNIYTKIFLSQEEINSASNLNSIRKKVYNSLEKLKIKKIDGLLIHNGCDITNKSIGLLLAAKEFKNQGLINQFGASLYQDSFIPEELLKDFDFIQVPFSIFNKDFQNNKIVDLCQKYKVDIHVRSIFCQGLVLCKPENIPSRFNKKDKFIIKEIYKIAQSKGYSLLNCACSFIKNKDWVHSIIFGVTSIDELGDVLSALNNPQNLDLNEINKLTADLSKHIKDPRNW